MGKTSRTGAHERLVRITLWLSVPFNFVAAWALAWPTSLPGQLIGLPAEVPAVYAALLAYLVAGFGLIYAWLASRPSIDRPLLTVGVLGKLGVFAISCGLWLAGHAPGTGVMVATGDLTLALIWGSWLLGIPAANTARRATLS